MHVAAAHTHGAVHPFICAFVSCWILFHIQYSRYCIQQGDLRLKTLLSWTVLQLEQEYFGAFWFEAMAKIFIINTSVEAPQRDDDDHHIWRCGFYNRACSYSLQQIRLCLQSIHSAHVCSATLYTLPFFCSLDAAWWNVCISDSVQMPRRLVLNHGARVTAMKSNMKAS